MSRGVFEVEVIRPTCDATLISLAGGLNEGWFSTLKNSARNSRSNRTVIRVCLYNAVSQLKYPGPNRRFRAEFPYVNCAGTANAAGLNHRWMLRFSSSGFADHIGPVAGPARHRAVERDRVGLAAAESEDPRQLPAAE